MSLFTERELYLLVRNQKMFALFTLSERERLVVKLRVNGFPFNHIGALCGRVSPARARHIYNRALKKMRQQLLDGLKGKTEKSVKTAPVGGEVYYIGGNGVWRGFGKVDVV